MIIIQSSLNQKAHLERHSRQCCDSWSNSVLAKASIHCSRTAIANATVIPRDLCFLVMRQAPSHTHLETHLRRFGLLQACSGKASNIIKLTVFLVRDIQSKDPHVPHVVEVLFTPLLTRHQLLGFVAHSPRSERLP